MISEFNQRGYSMIEFFLFECNGFALIAQLKKNVNFKMK